MKDFGERYQGVTQKLWKVNSEDGRGERFVITSASNRPRLGVLETYVFESDRDGNIVRYTELYGSERGILDHERAVNSHLEGPRGWESV